MRKLGKLEKLYAIAHELCHGWGMLTTVAFFHQQQRTNFILAELERVHHAQPLLQAKIDLHEELFHSGVIFEEIEVRGYGPDVPKEAIIQQEQCAPLKQPKSLWRIGIIGDQECCVGIVLSFHHAIAESMPLLCLLESLTTSKINASNHAVHSHSVLPSLDEIGPVMMGHAKPINTMPWSYEQNAVVKEQSTKSVFGRISKEQLKRIKEQAAHYKINLHDFLTGATIQALFSLRSEFDIVIHTPVSAREFCDPKVPRDYFGCYLMIHKTPFIQLREAQEDLRQLSKRFQADLYDGLFQSSPDSFFSTENLIRIFSEENINQRNNFVGGVAATYLNDFNQLRGYRDIYLSNILLGGYGIFAAIYHELNNELSINVSYTQPLISEKSAKKYFNRLMVILNGDGI